jgi:asparagine synthase (glutamine-hydrolysing)
VCGIAGIVDPDLSAEELRPIVQRMADTLVHRGPDDEGYFVRDGIGLGMRRLSIIDVAGGRQPIATEDGCAHVILNGEIYNYLELRVGGTSSPRAPTRRWSSTPTKNRAPDA